MSDCGLPDNFCVCWNLKKGGRFIAILSIGISVISCILITIYLSSDFEKIKQELADSHSEMADKLAEHKTCQFAIFSQLD